MMKFFYVKGKHHEGMSIYEFLKPYLKKHLIMLFLGTLFILANSLLILPSPLITRRILDKTIPNGNSQELVILIVIVFCLMIFIRIVSYFQGLLFYKVNSKVILDIRLDLLEKVNQLPMKINKQYTSGYLISRINDDTSRLRSLFADTIVSIVKDILTFLVGLVAVFIIHWQLALISITILPLYIFSTIYFSKKVREQSRMYFEDSAQTTMKLEESLNMLNLCKKFLRYKYNLLRYFKTAKKAFRSEIRLGKTSFLNGAVTGFISGLAPIIIIGYGGYEIIQGKFTIGSLIAFNAFVRYLFGPTNRLINTIIQIQKALIALQRVQELFKLPQEEVDRSYLIPVIIRQLQLKEINFAYKTEKQIFKSLSVTANKGERIGVVGGSGGGKTTLIRILTGLYAPDSGKYFVNGVQLENAQVVALRKCMAVVEQEPMLFNDTIYNNIKFGNTQAFPEEILKAAQLAHAEEFILNLENGYETIVDNNRLSIGQKQRIAIARALVRKPKILILDEATSNIDAISEKYINQTIEELPEEIIVFIIAHRLSTIRNCDKILVLEEGMIVEKGNHDELMKLDGMYSKLRNAVNV